MEHDFESRVKEAVDKAMKAMKENPPTASLPGFYEGFNWMIIAPSIIIAIVLGFGIAFLLMRKSHSPSKQPTKSCVQQRPSNPLLQKTPPPAPDATSEPKKHYDSVYDEIAATNPALLSDPLAYACIPGLAEALAKKANYAFPPKVEKKEEKPQNVEKKEEEKKNESEKQASVQDTGEIVVTPAGPTKKDKGKEPL